jgi:hypothetical protein
VVRYPEMSRSLHAHVPRFQANQHLRGQSRNISSLYDKDVNVKDSCIILWLIFILVNPTEAYCEKKNENVDRIMPPFFFYLLSHSL